MAVRSDFVVLLDLGRVVVDLMLDDWSRAVCPHDPGYAVSTFWHSSDKRAGDIGQQSPDVLLQRMVEDDNTSCESLAQARHYWQTMFSPVSGSEDAVRRIAQAFPVWIASDTDPLHFESIKNRWRFLADVEQSFVSFELGATKAETGFFEAIVESATVSPDRLILIDDRAVNCERAVSLGLQAIEFQDWSQASDSLTLITSVPGRERPT